MSFLSAYIPPNKEITSFGTYIPYWAKDDEGNRIKNPRFDNYSGRILDLKSSRAHGINYFFNKLKKEPWEGYIAIVPSHDPEKTESGIRELAEKLIEGSRFRLLNDGLNFIKRKYKISKLSKGGDRSYSNQLKSLKVVNPNEIKGKDIILLDDVTTTGNSLLACVKILEDAGASSVTCYALAQTE